MLAALVDRITRPIGDHAAAVLIPYLSGNHDAAMEVVRRRPLLTALCFRLGLLDALR